MRLTRRQFALLSALAEGCALKANRDLEGRKAYRLHRLDGTVEDASEADVHRLVDSRLLDSNKKFPVAAFWLTREGSVLAGGCQDESRS